MAYNWNGSAIEKENPDSPAQPGEEQQPTLAEALMREKENADYRRQLDRDLFRFLRSYEARDEEKCFKVLDDYTKNRWGVQTVRGNCWNPDRKPFSNARSYADALVDIMNRGYSAIATPEYKEWMKAKSSGDRNAMIQAAGIETQKMATKANANGGMSDFFDPGMGMPNAMEPKTDAEIDEELKDYGAKIEGQNFVDTYREVGRDFTPAEKEMVHAALKGGDGLPAEYEADFAYLVRNDPEKANRVLFCINRARRNERALARDVLHSFTKTAEDLWRGTVTFAEETAGALAENSVFQEMVRESSDSAKYYWNDAERAEYKRLCDTVGKGDTPRNYDPKAAVDRQCAERLRREAMPKEERIKERRERLMLDEAMGHQPYSDYNWFERSVIGAVSTIPYMAYTAVPYAGFCANVASYFEQTRDDILMAGGDMDEAVGTQLVLAAAWAAVEKLEFAGLVGRPMTALGRKAAICKIWKATGKDKLAKIGQLAAAGSKEMLASTICESIEEGVQGGIEGAEKAWFSTHDLGKALDAGGKQAVGDFVESIGTMGILSAVGTGWKTMRANANAADMESLKDYAAQRLQVMNTLRNSCVDPEMDVEQQRPAVQRIYNDMKDIWHAAPNGVAALDQIREKYDLDEKAARNVADIFDLEDAMLDTARRMKSDDQANLAATVAGAFRVGSDTTYDPVDLLHLVNPEIKVEDVEVDDIAKNPTQKPVSAETQELRGLLAEAQERIDNAKVGSERRAAEREYRRVNRKLKAAEANEEAPTYPKMRVRRVTVPVGKTGETKSFTITTNDENADIHTRGYGVSVANALKEAVSSGEIADGAKMTVEDFKQLPFEDKAKIAVTPDQYMAMTDKERTEYCIRYDLVSGGTFAVLDDKTGKEVFGTDAVVKLFRNAKTNQLIGRNWTLTHEYGHAISSFARDLGIIKTDSKSVAVMRKLFGDPTSDKELWNEEAANDAFANWLRDKVDFKRMTPEERKAARGFFKNMLATLRGLFSLSGNELPDSPVERTEREQALDAAFEAMRNGDFAGLDAFAGIDFAEDKATRPDATAPSVAPDAQEAASTTSAQKTENVTASANEAPVAAPMPQKATGTSVASEGAYVAFKPVAPESAPLRAGTKRTIFTPGYEMSVEADAMWVPLASLVESTDDREVQMRDRSRVATDQQVLTKTRKGVFQPLALFPGSKSDDGAPIVGGGLRIISGHGRKRMLDQLVKEGRYGEYLAAINAEAQRQGLPTSPEDMENPVLVSRVTGGLDKREDLTRFAELSNRWGGLERSGAEHAESDARKITDALLRLYAPDASGNLLAASNRTFMAAFLKEVGATGLTNADGTPTAEAALRVQRAMMTAIFGNDERTRALVQNLLERNQELSLATLQNALLKSAGKLLAMKRRHGSFDVVADVREAAYQYIAWRSAQASNPKLTLADHLNQSDFFSESVPPMQQALAKLLAEGRFGATLDKYAELVAQQADDAQSTFAGIADRRTPLQLLGLAERAILSEGDAPVTPDPASAEAAAPVQTAPAARVEPRLVAPAPSGTPTPVEAAQETISPSEPETFIPAPIKRGTATLPGPGASGIAGYQVSADGNPSTEKKNLPPGAYNLFRAPYDVRRPSAKSTQDNAGRGLYIANPPPTGHADIFPHFQGNKTEMAARTSQAIRRIMPKAEREHYETVVDYFGGGGCWGLYHALENFPNAKYLVINEWDSGRIEKIRLLQEIDGEVADRAKAIIDTFVDELRKACEVAKDGGESGSGKTIANKLGPRIEKFTGEERGVLTAFYDCASTMPGNNFDEAGSASFDLGMEKIYANLREDGRKAKAAADEFKARGGTIRYRQGDAANFPDAPNGDRVVAVCDPPYYLTANYNSDGSNAGIVPLDGAGWSYNATRNLLRSLVDKGDALVYTDEAWWHKESYAPNPAEGDDLFGNKSDFDREQEILLDITNTLDHFDVAGRVAGRQEVLGIHHGHDTKSEIGSVDAGDELADARGASDGRGGADDNRSSVRRMAGGAEGEDRAHVSSGSSRGREGRRALAREVVVQDVAASLAEASGATAFSPSVDAVARHSVRKVREDRMAAYAKTVGKNAKRWLAKAQKDLDAYMAAHGYTEKVWHGTEGEDFNVFRFSAISHDVPAVYFTYNHGTAQNYAYLRAEDVDGQPNTRQFYVNPGRVLDIDEDASPSTFSEFVAKITDAYNRGYDSVRVRNALDDQGIRLDENDGGEPRFTATEEEPELKTDILIVFDRPGNPGANRIKAADPVTFMDDVDGALPIPLDMRADQSVPDVRYSVKRVTTADDAAYMDAVKRGDRETALRMVREAAARSKKTLEGPKPNQGVVDNASYHNAENSTTNENGKSTGYLLDADGLPKVINTLNPIDVPEEYKAWNSSLPPEAAKEVASWDVISKSPYSDSFYNATGISWTHKPDGSLRIADHWNFFSRGERHCQTTEPIERGQWAMGRYDAETGKYTIVKKWKRGSDEYFDSQYEQRRQEIDLQENRAREIRRELIRKTNEESIDGLKKRIGKKIHSPVSNGILREVWMDERGDVQIKVEVLPSHKTETFGRWAVDDLISTLERTGEIKREDKYNYFVASKTGNGVFLDLATGQTKSADITYDDAGNVIPLSERFNPGNEDVRFSVRLKNYWKVLRGPFDAPQGAEVTSAGAYSARNRELAWGLKLGRQDAIDEAARAMSPSIPDNAVIVPMPNHDVHAVRTMLLAYAISGEKDGVDVVDALEAEPHETSHHTKKLGKSPQITMRRRDVEIPPNRPVVIVDNVYASGATFSAAKKVLPEASLNVLADAGRVQTKRETPEERHSVFIGIKGADKAKIAQGRLGKALELLDEYEIRRYKDDEDFDPAHDDAFRRDVYVKTGWWMGTDGMWRFEIADLKPKQRFGKTVGDGSMMKNGIMFADRKDHSHGYCDIESICRHPTLFEAYPELKDVSVKISDPDTMDGYVGQYNPAMNQIEITWDMVRWHDDEMSNVINVDGLKVLTHELQHAVQHIEDFNRGGSEKHNGRTNYDRLAGEVEARNAESRMFGVYGELQRPNADEAMCEEYADNYAPWKTEDVPQAKQILVGSDGAMRDQRGNPVARHSVRSYSRGRRVDDLAAALIASRRLAGKDMSMKDADKLVKNLGLSRIMKTADLVERANDLADRNREKLRTMVERGDPALVETLARQGYADSLAKQLDNLITGTAATANPDVGAKVQKAIQSKATRDLMNAHGFDAAQMMAELPVDLAQAIFAVAEYEKTPEELARIEAARKRREEERAAEDEMDEDEALAAVDDPAYREPTDEERAKLDALLDRARFMDEARKAEDERKKADKKRKAESSDDGSAPDGSTSGDAEGDGPSLPLDTVRRIAPVFESADLFASFIIEWTADHVADKHPNIPNTAEMWKNPVAVRELKQTATHILRKIAKDVLGSPSLNYARNFADHAINELESDAECRTFNAVRRKIARIYDQIHDHALSLSRRQMVKKLAKTIRQKAIERGRFSTVKEDLKRKIDAKTEQWCRWLVPALTMSDEKLQDEINRLAALVTVDPSDERATPEDKLREAADHLAVLHKYGGMVRWMPGRIADAEAEIMEQLDGKRAEFEARREERLAKDKAIRDAIVAAVRQGAASSYRKHTKLGDAVNRYTSAMMGNLTLEMQNLVRYCTDPSLRTAALEAIEEMQTWISEGGSRYRTILGQAQAELHEGLALCYGNAEAGIRHLLRDEIPTEAANAIFTQGKDRVPTYGQLLQLYASSIQADYRDNAQAHGRTAALPLMEATLTDADRRFHDWSVEWFKRNRKALSDSVEAVTGLPVTSPDALYTPVRILREKTGFDAEGMGSSPVPSALNRRILHDLDFNEGANFLACLQEQAEVRAQTIGYAEIGIRLRDTIAHRDVQSAVRKDVGKADMKVVTDHVRDVLVQNAARKDESAFWAPLNVARKWMARFYLSGNVPSALKQLASMPVWANAMIGGKTVGLARCLHYLATVGTDEGRAALRELMASDGFKARYTMGWSEETQNVLQNPSKNRLMRYIERAYDKGMVVNKAVDGVSCLWMAQGFYRDATQCFVDKGFTPDEAKQKAMALTWSCLESGQQSGRVENMNTLQRRGGAGVAAIFQFKTAYLLQNNYLIQAMREMKAGTPGARGRFLRALFVNTVWIPAFVATVNAAWSAIMGEPEPPEDEETWPTWFKAMCWSMIDGVTAPMFGLDSALHTLYDQMTNTRNWRQDSEIPAVSGAIRVSRDAARVVYDLGKYGLQSFDAFDFEEELDGEKLGKDVNRLVKDLLAPYRHGAKAVENRSNDND